MDPQALTERNSTNVIDAHLFSSLENQATTGGLTRTEFFSAIKQEDQEESKDLTNGAQASVTIISSKETGEKYVVKIIGAEKKLSESEAKMLIDQTKSYQEELKRAGIEVPRMYSGVPLMPGNDTEGWQIGMVEELVGDGKNVKDIFQNPIIPLEQKVKALKDLAELLINLPQHKDSSVKSDVGGDFRPANFVKKDDRYILIDTFSPKRVQADGQVGPYIAQLEQPLTPEAMTFLCGDKRGELSALFYFSLRHVRNDPTVVGEFNNAIADLITTIPDADVREYLAQEHKTGYEQTSQIYQTADIAHLPEEIRKSNERQAGSSIPASEVIEKKHNPTPLPDSSMHDPKEVAEFVEGYLAERNISPREVKLQMIGVKALQNPDIIKRFLVDFKANKEKSSYHGEVGMFVIDDSWDADKAAEIQAVAAEAGVDYFRVRIDEGFANDIIRKFGEKIQANDKLTDAEKKYHFWLARALLKDRLQAPLTKDVGNFTINDALAELGGIAGTQNFGYLVSAYEAGKRGIPLDQMTVTINEDDQRYVTLAQDTDGKIITESPDLLAERAAWFEDSDTIATVGRYTGHTGNPISMVKDTLQASTRILSDHNSGESNTYNIFNPNSGTFQRMSSEDAYKMLPQILRAAAQRQSIIGLWTKDKHYKPLVDWDEASKLDLGNITLSGAALPGIITPLGGVFDYNFSGLLRAQAVQADDENRLIRREESLMHHRVGRSGGGDAFGTEIAAAFNNSYAKEQRKISHVLETDVNVRHELMETLGISRENEELFNKAIRTFDANGRKLQDIKDLRKLFELQVSSAEMQGDQNAESQQVIESLKIFLKQFPEGLIDEVEANVIKPPRIEEIKEVRKGIKRFTQMYKVWPDILQTAYEMGAAEGGFTLDEIHAAEQRETINNTVPVEVGYLPGVSAHTGRPLEVALKLAESGIPTVMRGGDSGRKVFGLKDTWETSGENVTVENSSLFYYHPGELIRGEFTVEQMTENIVKIVESLRDNPPPFVLVDHNVPLLMAAKAAGVPSVAITNMSNVGFCSDTFIDAIGPTARKLADKYYVPLEPKLQEVYEKVYQRLNKGESPTDKPNWFQIMETGADLTLIADCPAFVEDGISDNFKLEPMLNDLTEGKFAYVGSIQPDTIIDQSIDQDATEQALLRMEVAKIAGNKVLLGSFGSIRKPELYEALFALARNNPKMLLVVTTADAELPDDIPQNFHAVKFGKLTELAKHADVMLCQGGSGTLYPLMKEGNGGIINITTNADQQYNAALIEQHGLGRTLPIESLTAEGLQEQVLELIANQDVYQGNLADISDKIELNGARNAAAIIKQRFNL